MRTSARSGSSPTRKRTTRKAPAGQEVEYTYSTPGIDQKAFSSGAATCRSTSTGPASRQRREDVDHRDLDLRLFLAGRDDDGQRAEGRGEEDEERRQLRIHERARQATGDAELRCSGTRRPLESSVTT